MKTVRLFDENFATVSNQLQEVFCPWPGSVICHRGQVFESWGCVLSSSGLSPAQITGSPSRHVRAIPSLTRHLPSKYSLER